MTRTLTVLGVFLIAIGAPIAASADTTAVVVAGDPGKKATVVDAIAPWLQGKAQSVVLDTLPDADVDKLVDCFLTDDESCAKKVVAAAGVGKLVFVMVQVNEEGAAQLSGWLFDGDGKPLGAERKQCDDCRVEALSRAAEELIGTLWRAVEPMATLHVTSTPPGASVSVDGKDVGMTPLNYEVAPGAHEVVLSLGGYTTASRSVEPVAGATQEVAVTMGHGGGGGGRRKSKLPWIVMGAGAAAIVTGGVLIAMDEDAPPLNPSGPEPKQYFDSAFGGASLLVVGALVVGGGVYLWLRDRDLSPEQPGVVVQAGPHGGFVGWRGQF